MNCSTKVFITGSHAYGRPNSASDLDLVVFTDQSTAEKLRVVSRFNGAVRFGKLNIILCYTENEFTAWKTTTDRLRAIHLETGAIFDKIAATVEFEKDRAFLGVEYHGDSEQGR